MRSLLFAVLSILCTLPQHSLADDPQDFLKRGITRGEALIRFQAGYEKSCDKISESRVKCLVELQNGEKWQLTYALKQGRGEYDDTVESFKLLQNKSAEEIKPMLPEVTNRQIPPPPPQFFQPDPNAFINAANVLTSRPQPKSPDSACGMKPIPSPNCRIDVCHNGFWKQVCWSN